MARIDVSRPSFLARDDLPPVVLPLQRILPKTVAALEEEIAFSRLSLEEEIEKLHFEEEENPGALIVSISDTEGETDKHSGVHLPTFMIACSDSSSKEKEDETALNKGNKSLRDLKSTRNKVSNLKETTTSQVPPTLPPPPPPLPTNLGLKAIPDLKKKRPIQELEKEKVGP